MFPCIIIPLGDIMYRLPVEPYYVNAANWWLENNNSNNDQFKVWLKSQGTVIEEHDSYYPWLDFEDPLEVQRFMIRFGGNYNA